MCDLIINQDKFDPHNNKVLWNRDLISIALNYSMKRKNPPIDEFKNSFGRQLKTWVGGSDNYRFYIWTFRFNQTVLYAYVHNKKGICFEYPLKTRKKDLMNIIIKIYNTLLTSL
jgi:hypothetical protein